MGESGADQRNRTRREQERLPNLQNFYHRRLSDFSPGDFDFSFQLKRPSDNLMLTRFLLDCTWEDAGATMRGSLTVRRPEPEAFLAVSLQRGHQVECSFRWHQKEYTAWNMRLVGEPSVDPLSGIITAELADDLDNLDRNERKWEFKEMKAHEIARAVARKEGVPIGKIAQGTEEIKKLKMRGSGLDVIKKAYKREREETAVRFIIRLRDGKLEVVPFQRPSVLYEIRDLEETASLAGTPKREKPRTIIHARGHKKDGEKLETTVAVDEIVARFGRSTMEKNYGRVSGMQELRDRAQRDLAREIEVKRSGTLLIPGIPFLERGSTLHWRQKEPGWIGDSAKSRDRQYVYVRAARHSYSATTHYTTEVDVTQEDPYLADRERRDREARDKKKGENK